MRLVLNVCINMNNTKTYTRKVMYTANKMAQKDNECIIIVNIKQKWRTLRAIIILSSALLHTTSVLVVKTPSLRLSRAIHLNGSLTLSLLSCLKYPLPISSSTAKPKSVTFMMPSLSILCESE